MLNVRSKVQGTSSSYRKMRDFCALLLILAGLSQLFGVQGFSQSSIHRVSPKGRSPLFQFRPSFFSEGKKQSFIPILPSRNSRKNPVSFSPRQVQAYAFRLLSKLKRSLLILTASFLIWFGAASIQTLPSHASTASSATVTQSRNVLSASLEQIVDRYVRDHMFDDDVYEPVESIYREAMADKMRGTHPKALSEITSSILGQDGVKLEKSSSSNGLGDWLMNAVGFLQRKGLSESTAVIVLTGTLVVAGPIAFLLGAMMVGSQSKRQIQSVMKKRYGDTYTVDATIKIEEEVEAPDDDEDEDDDQDKKGDDDDDDDE